MELYVHLFVMKIKAISQLKLDDQFLIVEKS